MGEEQLREFYWDLPPPPWNILPDAGGKVQTAARFKDNTTKKFTGKVLEYAAWRMRALVSVHMLKMTLAHKVICLSSLLEAADCPLLSMLVRGLTCNAAGYKMLVTSLEREFGGQTNELETAVKQLLDSGEVRMDSLESVRAFRMQLLGYENILTNYGRREFEFTPNSQLYRELLRRKFSKSDRYEFQKEIIARAADRGREKWQESPVGILRYLDLVQEILSRTMVTEKQFIEPPTKFSFRRPQEKSFLVTCQEGEEDNSGEVPQDCDENDIQAVLMTGVQSGKRMSLPPCDWNGVELSLIHI